MRKLRLGAASGLAGSRARLQTQLFSAPGPERPLPLLCAWDSRPPGDTSADPVNEMESRRQSLWPLVTPGLSPQPWWASTWQINSDSRERKAPPTRSEDGPPRTRGNLGAPQIWRPNPAGSPCVCALSPWLSPPEEGRGPAGETLGRERRRERMRRSRPEGEWGRGRRRDTYCSWGSGRTASGPVTPCPGSGRGGAPAPAPGLAPGLAPSPGPSPGPGPGHLQMQTCGADRVLCTPLHTRTLHLLSLGSRGPYRGAVAPDTGAWACCCGLDPLPGPRTGWPGLGQANALSGGADALSGGPLLLQALPVSQLLRSKPSGGPSANPPWPSQPRPVLTCSPLDYRETEHHPQSTAASESCLENREQMNSCAGKVEMNFTTQRLWAQPETTYCKFQTASKF